MKNKERMISERLRDERSRKVLFVSHCILNENTRYPGGAFYPGVNPKVINEIAAFDCGVVQMPCPEQAAWGGVSKKLIWLPLGIEGKNEFSLLKMMLPGFVAYTKFRYGIIASRAVTLIQDYIDDGYEVLGYIGIDGSPTCGVKRTLDIRRVFECIAGLELESAERKEFNRLLHEECSKEGEGLFIDILKKKLERRGMKIKFYSVDIIDEMKGV